MTQTSRALPVAAFIRRETLVGGMISAVISAGFFLALFPPAAAVRVAGVDGYAFDFLPQSAGIALMAALMPGLLGRRAARLGKVSAAVPDGSAVPAAFGGAAVGVGLGGLISLALIGSGVATVGWLPGLGIKLVYGAALGAMIARRTLIRLFAAGPAPTE